MQGTNLLVQPDYTFRDANLKFSGHSKTGDSYSLSTLAGQDRFSYSVNQQIQATNNNMVFNQTLNEEKIQYGASLRYNKVWKGIGSNSVNISYSDLQSDIYDKQTGTNMQMSGGMHSGDSTLFRNKEQQIRNTISEFKAEIANKIRLSTAHELEFAGAYIYNNVLLLENNPIDDTKSVNINAYGAQFMTYLQDRYEIIKNINFTAGLRTDYSINLNKTYFQPRISLTAKPWSVLQINAAWGIYNQFIVKTAVVDENNNYRYLWMVSDNEQIPVLTAQHYVLGTVFNLKGFSLSIESFYKEAEGITRLITSDTQNELYTGKSKTKGIDFFAKQEYRGHSFWVSYTLSQSLEWFPFFIDNSYQPALQDQRHEIKLSGIINLSPFYLSANYVYGSGFLQNTNLSTGNNYPYIRLDIAGFYNFSVKKKIKLQTGISVLNVLNRENIKYSNLIQVPTDGVNTLNIYSEAVPFTPTIFLNISF
ncbi:MAG: TonB-dependent receptor, partial [Bacteroidales bacterium]|nr:TonB-dependent receptor [Bacteroidales bacterium]